MPETCEFCKYFIFNGQRSAPYYFDDKNKQIWSRPCARYPAVVYKFCTDFCGEFKEKNAVQLKESS
jgi:hypothetical protein